MDHLLELFTTDGKHLTYLLCGAEPPVQVRYGEMVFDVAPLGSDGARDEPMMRYEGRPIPPIPTGPLWRAARWAALKVLERDVPAGVRVAAERVADLGSRWPRGDTLIEHDEFLGTVNGYAVFS